MRYTKNNDRDIITPSEVTDADRHDVCVLHIKPFFLPFETQCIQCPYRFFLLESRGVGLRPEITYIYPNDGEVRKMVCVWVISAKNQVIFRRHPR